MDKIWEKYCDKPIGFYELDSSRCISKSQFQQAADEICQLQREACCREFLTEYNSGNYDDPITFMNKTKDKILNAEVKSNNPELEGL